MNVQKWNWTVYDESVRVNYLNGSPDEARIPVGLNSFEFSVGTLNDEIDEPNGSIQVTLLNS